MTTRTTGGKTSQTGRTNGAGASNPPAQPSGEAAGQPKAPEAALYMALHLPGRAPQTVGLDLQHPEWETTLDGLLKDTKMMVLRWQLAQMRQTQATPAPTPQPQPVKSPQQG